MGLKELKQLWTQREPALLKTGAIIGTGLGVSAATGGAGLMPYLYGIGAATGASIALDGAVQARLATGCLMTQMRKLLIVGEITASTMR